MKTLFATFLGILGLVSFTGCESDGDDHDHDDNGGRTVTTTTEESTLRRPVSATTETHTVREY